jgi:hypothetical protein
MKGVVSFFALALAACVARQGLPAESSKDWKPVEVAELRGECVASYIDRGLDPTRARALCSCAIPRLTEIFSYTWFNDGQAMSADELRAMSSVYQGCAKDVLQSESPSELGSGVRPDPDRTTAQVEL